MTRKRMFFFTSHSIRNSYFLNEGNGKGWKRKQKVNMKNRMEGKPEENVSPAEGVHPCPGVGARSAVRPWVWARQAHGGPGDKRQGRTEGRWGCHRAASRWALGWPLPVQNWDYRRKDAGGEAWLQPSGSRSKAPGPET